MGPKATGSRDPKPNPVAREDSLRIGDGKMTLACRKNTKKVKEKSESYYIKQAGGHIDVNNKITVYVCSLTCLR